MVHLRKTSEEINNMRRGTPKTNSLVIAGELTKCNILINGETIDQPRNSREIQIREMCKIQGNDTMGALEKTRIEQPR